MRLFLLGGGRYYTCLTMVTIHGHAVMDISEMNLISHLGGECFKTFWFPIISFVAVVFIASGMLD